MSSGEPVANDAKEFRVLQIYSGNLYGGIETLLVTLAKSRSLFPMIERYFAICFPGRLRDELLAAGAPVYDLGPVRFSRPWTVFRARARLSRLLRDIHFDAAMTHACWSHTVFAPTIRHEGVRLVHGIHDQLTGKHWTERLAGRTPPDMVIANSHFSAGHGRTVFPDSPMEVIYHPLPFQAVKDLTVRERVRAGFGTPRDRVVFLQASRLEELKGHSVHIAALSKLRDEPEWEAWFAGGAQKSGEQDYLKRLEAEAIRGGVADRVKFLGQRSDVPQLMAAADVYCQPNTGPESFGFAFVEALASGLPVVTSNIGGGAEIVTPECGLLTAPGDAESVAAALRRILREPALRRVMSQAAPRHAMELCDEHRQLARRAVVLLGPRATPELRAVAELPPEPV